MIVLAKGISLPYLGLSAEIEIMHICLETPIWGAAIPIPL